ncbi:hypothetical protein M1L60_42055 [Actinoplanes sp. TRM 88003]|uniref:Uncharacterized protein n=1 Tax=Paractinoplanes aksuensis TaxID=2939490 RepID=A0ABT1E4V3_9ACTN|nr:hypothetical protein [Actinoplanes aksuensis]MCO8277180.1 hypothetical protein [Actinoplanes aksuensis]
MPEPGPNPIDLGEPIDIGTPPPASSDEDPDTDADSKTKSKRPVRRVLIAILLAVATAAVAMLGFTSWRIIAQRHAELEIQPSVGPLSLDYSREGASTADYLRTALAAEVELDRTYGAVYQEAPDKNVLFLAGTGLLWTPGKDLDAAMNLISDGEGAVTELKTVDPGPLDGTMKCGITKSSDGDLTVCGWADHGSLALAMFNNRTPAEAAPLMLALRNATESR